jgi:hypothetical protein
MKILLTLGILVTLFYAGVANAAPVYRGRFSLPYEVRWGQAVVPAGEYLVRFVDVQARVFVVIQDAKSGKDVAYLSPVTSNEARGTSALFISDEGERVVQSMQVAELGEIFIYKPARLRGTEDIREAHKVQTLSIMEAKK